MGIRDFFRRASRQTVKIDQPPPADMREFDREEFGQVNGVQLVTLLSGVLGEIGPHTRPQDVPFHILEAMGWDPIIYLGEQSVTAPVKDPDLYFVRHSDPVVVAETEAWLRPLLPQLLPIIARAFALGVVPYVFDWTISDLPLVVKREGGAERNRNVRNHVHYCAVHDIRPDNVQLEVENDKLVALNHNQSRYRTDRAYVSVFDKQWGEFFGMGSRRRAYRAWFDEQLVSLWQARWLERSVDPPRIGFAPKGKVKVDGKEVLATELLTAALMSLKNGGATVLPSEIAADSNQRIWGIDLLQLPDRSEVWDLALNRLDAQKLLACLVPPTSVGVEEATFAGARVPAQVFIEFVQCLAKFIASELTLIVGTVHATNRGTRVPAPTVGARDIPAAKAKLLLEVFRIASDVERQVGEGKVVTLAELVSDEVVDMLGIPKLPADKVAREKQAPPTFGQDPGGRPRDFTSDRQERRENAREPEGEDATGDDDEAPEE